MISEIAANTAILGKPLFVHIGVIGFLLMISTAMIPTLNKKLAKKIPMKFHFWLARTTVLVVIVHVVLAASLYLGF
jgi:cytochrome b561